MYSAASCSLSSLEHSGFKLSQVVPDLEVFGLRLRLHHVDETPGVANRNLGSSSETGNKLCSGSLINT